jgi:hypothetical protein
MLRVIHYDLKKSHKTISKEEKKGMIREEASHAVSAAIYCAGIGVALMWLIVFTLVLSIILSEGNQDLNNAISIHNSDIQRLDQEVDTKTSSVVNATNELDDASPCLIDLCTPSVFDRIVDAWRCLGCWDANSNVPTLVSGEGTQGDMYVVCVAGSTLLDGVNDWAVYDLVMYVDDETRWARVGSTRTDLSDNGTHISLITQPLGNDLELATLHGANGFNITRMGDLIELGATLLDVTTQVRDYNRSPYYGMLNGTTNVANATNSVSLSTPNVTTPAVVREYWTRSGDILEAFITIAFKPASTGSASITLKSWPTEIVQMEFGGVGNASTVTRNTVACSMVLTDDDEGITPAPNGTIIQISNDVTGNGCVVNSPGLAQDTEIQLWSEYTDVPVSTSGVDAYNHQLWHLRFISVDSF